MTEEIVKNALKAVKYPGYSRDIVSFGIVKDIQFKGNSVNVGIQLGSAKPEVAEQIKRDAETVLKQIQGIGSVQVVVSIPEGQPGQPGAQSGSTWQNQSKIPGIKRIVAVASGKGGVGKSTVAVNLACGLAKLGLKIGLLDCDIYGPSIPLMMGINQRPMVSPEEKLIPPSNYGVKLMSIGFMLEGDTPVIWRGPMIVKTIQQFMDSVEWGELDCLLVDLPPGTGDAQLTLCQTVPLDGGVIVTTPQEASLGVMRKGYNMFVRLNVPILGIIENMSYFTTPSGERVEIFGHGGGRNEAQKQKTQFLGEIPLFVEIREGGDKGVPVVVSGAQAPAGKAFMNVAEMLKNSWK
jgi:ATP-binding protein involved in chromosome partitioning